MPLYQHQLTKETVGPVSSPIPPGTTQLFLPTPSGSLELLASLPPTSDTNPPLLFLHGGFGSARCYTYFLPFFSLAGYPSYALSLRGHGASWNPGYVGLYRTSFTALCSDAALAVSYIRSQHPGKRVVVIGHSSGGGIAQRLLSGMGEGDEEEVSEWIEGAVLLASQPGYGSWPVNLRWMWMDWLALLRTIWHGWHPRSPLSSTFLVKRAFFSNAMSEEAVAEVEKTMSQYESIGWVNGMLWRFVDPSKVVERLWEGGKGCLVVAGEGDRLMGVWLMRKLAEWYRQAMVKAGLGDKEKTVEDMVQFEVVEGLGHHMMLDVEWKRAADVVLEWLQKAHER